MLAQSSTLLPAVVGDCEEGGFPRGETLEEVEVGRQIRGLCRSVADEGGVGAVRFQVIGVPGVAGGVDREDGWGRRGGRDEERLVGGPVGIKVSSTAEINPSTLRKTLTWSPGLHLSNEPMYGELGSILQKL